jgi:hypothetical protein
MTFDAFAFDNDKGFDMPGLLCNSQIAELAMFIDAIPANFRQEILIPALKYQSHAECDTSDLAGYLFASLSDYVSERTGNILDILIVQSIPNYVLTPRLAPLSRATDPAQVAIALVDFFDFVMKTVQNDKKNSPHN